MFVFVRDAKPKRCVGRGAPAAFRTSLGPHRRPNAHPTPPAPRRKVAVPVPDGYTWADFLGQVRTKLKIVGVKEIYLAAVRRGGAVAGASRPRAWTFDLA